jgi:hypothetical protein
VTDPTVAYSAFAAFGLVGAAILGVGFLLRREAEQFFTENKDDAKAIRARFQGRFHQRFSEEVNRTIDRAAGDATSIELKVLKENIATEALQAEHETGISKVGAELSERDAALAAFTNSRDKKMEAGGSVIGIGIILILSAFYFILPADVQAADGVVMLILLGVFAISLVVFGVSAYSDHAAASKKFFEFCDRELRDL